MQLQYTPRFSPGQKSTNRHVATTRPRRSQYPVLSQGGFMTAMRRSCFALIVLLAAPVLVRADLTPKPNAYTEKDRHRECVEFNLKTLVDSYKSIGNKNAPWDSEAIKFLESASQHFADVG